jgi:ABC-type oligopeptide transport system substrate-binding subunit
MTKRWLAALVIGIAVVALAAYAAAGQTSTTKTLKSGGTFRIGTSSRIDSLNPTLRSTGISTLSTSITAVQYDKSSSKSPISPPRGTTSNGGKT